MKNNKATLSLLSTLLAITLSWPAIGQGVRDTSNLVRVVNEPVSNSSISVADQAFFKTAVVTGMTEIAAGKLAVAQGSTDKIKAMGQRLVDDHSKAAAGLKELAARKYITLPDALDTSHQGILDVLSDSRGEAFDTAFLANMQQGHADSISAFLMAAKSSDSDIAQFAKATLPTLKSHQMSIMALSKIKPMSNQEMPMNKDKM